MLIEKSRISNFFIAAFFFAVIIFFFKRACADAIQLCTCLLSNDMKKNNYLFSIALLTAGLLCTAASRAEESQNQVFTASSAIKRPAQAALMTLPTARTDSTST